MKLFYLSRKEDVSGTSGVGVVAEGVEFDDGSTALHWLSDFTSTAIYSSLSDLKKIHGHEGRTLVVQEGDPDYEQCKLIASTKVRGSKK